MTPESFFRPTEVRSPAEALAAIEPYLASFGITRVGDLTGLDVIGIPVFFACRPNSRSLAVCQGKALQPERARLGAIMECIEQTFAERGEDLVVATANVAEMQERGLHCVDASTMWRSKLGSGGVDRRRAWVKGFSAVSGNEIHVPFELVGLDFRSDIGWDTRTFRMCSVGLAAASSPPEAALHALFELIEHDATAPIEIFGLQPGLARPVVHRRGLHCGLDEAVALVEAAGLTCFFVNLTSRFGLPVIGAFLRPGAVGPTMLGGRVFAGFACRFSPGDAALGALLEAVQSRLTQISGARDDILPGQYVPADRLLRQVRGEPTPLDLLPEHPASDISLLPHEKLRRAVEAVIEAGVEDVLLVPLGGETAGLSVVRVLAPGLQAYAEDGEVRLGLHLFRALLGQA